MQIKNISLTISLIGILILLLIINTSQPNQIKISDINSSILGKQVTITGKVVKVNTYKSNFTIISLQQDTNQINITCNCPDIKKNQNLIITGIVSEYKNQIQINANQILLHEN